MPMKLGLSPLFLTFSTWSEFLITQLFGLFLSCKTICRITIFMRCTRDREMVKNITVVKKIAINPSFYDYGAKKFQFLHFSLTSEIWIVQFNCCNFSLLKTLTPHLYLFWRKTRPNLQRMKLLHLHVPLTILLHQASSFWSRLTRTRRSIIKLTFWAIEKLRNFFEFQ